MKRFSILFLLFILFIFTGCRNKLTVDFGNLNPNDFDIYLSDGIPLQYNKCPTLIYKDGMYYDIPNEYGENDWVIYYKRQWQCVFRHFKTNRRYTHRYKFAIFEKQDTLYCAINIRGKNSEKDTICFTPVVSDL